MGSTAHLAMGLKLLVLLGALLCSFVLFWMVLRPRRRGTTPRCARCDYNLTGLSSERCPECGTEMLPANIVYGELVRRPWSKIATGVLIVLLLIPTLRWVWQYEW